MEGCATDYQYKNDRFCYLKLSNAEMLANTHIQEADGVMSANLQLPLSQRHSQKEKVKDEGFVPLHFHPKEKDILLLYLDWQTVG